MSEANKPQLPFKPLGSVLKKMRVSRQQSLAEVSGAVEIDVDTLQIIEQGSIRPNEEILSLLISYFDIKDSEADKLWSLAGYDITMPSANDEKQVVMITPEDLKIVYTDMLHVAVNDFGVVMNFMQGAGPGSQPLAIARIGMSKQHAESVIEVLQKTLKAAKPKQLPADNQNK